MKYANALLLDLVQVALAVLWIHHGLDGAGNAFVAVSWAIVVVMLVQGLTSIVDGMKFTYGRAWAAYNIVRTAVKALAYAWLGLFWLFGVYVFASIIVAAARHQYTIRQAETQASA